MSSVLFRDYLEKLKSFLTTRKQAYEQVFNPESLFARRVLQDLAKFCRAHESTFHPDPRIHAAIEGRREVFLRITQHLNLTSDELWALFGRKDLE